MCIRDRSSQDCLSSPLTTLNAPQEITGEDLCMACAIICQWDRHCVYFTAVKTGNKRREEKRREWCLSFGVAGDPLGEQRDERGSVDEDEEPTTVTWQSTQHYRWGRYYLNTVKGKNTQGRSDWSISTRCWRTPDSVAKKRLAEVWRAAANLSTYENRRRRFILLKFNWMHCVVMI